MIIKIIGILFFLILLTFIYCCMKVSSVKSRWEEIEQENKQEDNK